MTDPIHLNVTIDPLPGHALTVEQAVAATMNALCHALLPAEGQDRVADLAVTADPPPSEPGVHWRTGAKLGRTLYQHYGADPTGELVGLMDTPELAAKVAQAVNAQTAAQPAESHTDGAAAAPGPTASPDGESGTEDLDAIEADWLQQCPVHDGGLPGDCACLSADYRPTMSDLVGKLRRARARADDLVQQADMWHDRYLEHKGGEAQARHELEQANARVAELEQQRDQARAELETARHVIRTNPQMRLSWVPADQLDAARAEAHAVGYEAGWRDGAASKRET